MKYEEINKCCGKHPNVFQVRECDANGYAFTIIACEECEFSSALKKTIPDATRAWNQMLWDIGIN